MIQLYPDFKEFLKLLNEKKVKYLLIGGYAVAHYGYVRATSDIDFWVDISDDNANNILEALADFGFSNINKEIFLNPSQIARMGLPPLRIELSTSIDGVNFSDCYVRSQIIQLDGVDVNIINLEDLRQNKKASGRPKDLIDLEHLPKTTQEKES